MLIDRLRERMAKLAAVPDEVTEHEAVVDLLALAMYADRRITQGEFDELEAFEADHADWDGGPFNTHQYLGQAVSKAREAIGATGDVDAYVADIAARLTSASLRAEALDACISMLDQDTSTDDELTFLRKVRAALG